jgi:ribonuclease HII
MILVGIDEVGRGCWAGPLVAAAVILPADLLYEDGPINHKIILRDSKKMSKNQRETAADFINANALAVGIGWVWPEDIDISGITTAVKRAMEQAVEAIKIDYDEVIIDGNIDYLAAEPALIGRTYYGKTKAVIKADDSVPAVSAASIVAKVARDNYMAEMAARYPEYSFEKHVGYGTAAHIAALKLHGVTELHRKSYKPIQKIMEQFA